MRDFDIDGHYITAPTRAAAIKEYVELFGTQPETVEEYEIEDEDDFDPADEQATYDDQWGDSLEIPSYAS